MLRKLCALAIALFLSVAPVANAIDLEPGECYQYMRIYANACGGETHVTYETCMDEFGELHTEVISSYTWCN